MDEGKNCRKTLGEENSQTYYTSLRQQQKNWQMCDDENVNGVEEAYLKSYNVEVIAITRCATISNTQTVDKTFVMTTAGKSLMTTMSLLLKRHI